jgi:hypothetical protein
VPQAKLNQYCVDRSDLNAIPSTRVADLCGLDVVFAIRLEKSQRSESFNELASRLRPGKALQQFLQDQAGGEHLVCAFKRTSKHLYGLGGTPSVAAESQRPDGRVNEQAHDLRARSAL